MKRQVEETGTDNIETVEGEIKRSRGERGKEIEGDKNQERNMASTGSCAHHSVESVCHQKAPRWAACR